MSKLDDAFMKAYAKVREAGPQSVAGKEASSAKAVPLEAPSGAGEPELISFVRLEDGVAELAAELAQTSDGRTRGTTADPGGNGVAAGRGMPMGPDTKLPESDDGGGAVLIDSNQTVGAPHFHSIAVSLGAYETVGPRESVRELEPAVAARLDEAPSIPDLAALYSQSLDTMTLPQAIVPQAIPPQTAPVASMPATIAPVTEPRVEPRPEGDPRDPRVNPSDDGANRGDGITRDQTTRTRTDQRHESVVAPLGSPQDSEPANRERVRQDAEDAEHELFGRGGFPEAEQSQVADDSPIDIQPAEPATDSNAASSVSESSFQAAWEVDCFEFPALVWELSVETSLLWQAAEQLQLACQEGLQVLAITSPARRHGRSTLALTLARMLAGKGLSVALVDADVEGPDVARHLQLEIETGWYEALRSGLSVDEVAVHSLEDGFTVLPMATAISASAPRLDELTTGGMLAKLRSAFDLVLLDTTSIGGLRGWIPGTGPDCEIDAALVVQDIREPDQMALDACLKRLQQLGIDNVGLVENFT